METEGLNQNRKYKRTFQKDTVLHLLHHTTNILFVLSKHMKNGGNFNECFSV